MKTRDGWFLASAIGLGLGMLAMGLYPAYLSYRYFWLGRNCVNVLSPHYTYVCGGDAVFYIAGSWGLALVCYAFAFHLFRRRAAGRRRGR